MTCVPLSSARPSCCLGRSPLLRKATKMLTPVLLTSPLVVIVCSVCCCCCFRNAQLQARPPRTCWFGLDQPRPLRPAEVRGGSTAFPRCLNGPSACEQRHLPGGKLGVWLGGQGRIEGFSRRRRKRGSRPRDACRCPLLRLARIALRLPSHPPSRHPSRTETPSPPTSAMRLFGRKSKDNVKARDQQQQRAASPSTARPSPAVRPSQQQQRREGSGSSSTAGKLSPLPPRPLPGGKSTPMAPQLALTGGSGPSTDMLLPADPPPRIFAMFARSPSFSSDSGTSQQVRRHHSSLSQLGQRSLTIPSALRPAGRPPADGESHQRQRVRE